MRHSESSAALPAILNTSNLDLPAREPLALASLARAALLPASLMLACAGAWAKLPPPSDDAKAKAAEAAAKAAWQGKVDSFQLCKAMNHVAERYAADAKKAGRTVTPTPTPPCTDPGPFTAAATASAAPAAAPAAPGTTPAKKSP